MRAIKKILYFTLLLPFSLFSQNVMTSSPYSMFGLGEITSGLYGQNAAMGGVSYGMRDSWLMNSQNPAGLTGLDSMKLFAEASAFLKYENYSSKGSSNHAFTGNFSAFSLGARIMPKWYMAVGLQPYTSVGYYFYNLQQVEGTNGSYTASLFKGDGGLSTVYLTHAFLLLPNLSVGVNLNYIFGTLTQTESGASMSVEQKMFTHMFYADFGIQYHRAIGKKTSLTLGAVYGYEQKLKVDNNYTVTGNYSENDYSRRKVTQYLPQYYGVGGTLKHKKMTYALDYTFHEYGKWYSNSSQVKFQDTHEVSTGICYDPSGQGFDGYFRRVKYKAGLNISNPYYKINGNSGIAWRASAGMAFPVLGGYLNTALFYDRMQIRNNSLQRSLIGLTVTYTLSERMYRVKL